ARSFAAAASHHQRYAAAGTSVDVHAGMSTHRSSSSSLPAEASPTQSRITKRHAMIAGVALVILLLAYLLITSVFAAPAA
ncbi:MAG: hypothetical protein ACRD7E_17475, partial [Bryobacteraceae bacterium]